MQKRDLITLETCSDVVPDSKALRYKLLWQLDLKTQHISAISKHFSFILDILPPKSDLFTI